MDHAPLIDEVHAIVAQREKRAGSGPLVVGGVPGSGTRAAIQLFHSLGVHAAGDSRWDSHICLGAGPLSCRSLQYGADNFTAMVWQGYLNQMRGDVVRYLSPHPFAGHCYGDFKEQCDCGCHEEEAPLGPHVTAGAAWGFKQPECYAAAPLLQALYPAHTLVMVVRDGKDAHFSSSSRDQLNCKQQEPWGPLDTLQRWADVNMQVLAWAKEHAYGESFFVLRTEDLVDAAADARVVPVVLRALASVGLRNVTAAHVEDALFKLRRHSLGSDTGGLSMEPHTAYGKWRQHRGSYQGMGEASKVALRQLGYFDHEL